MKYLIHIGYVKTASTWLQSTLFSGEHPELKPLGAFVTTQKSGKNIFGNPCDIDFDPVQAAQKIKSKHNECVITCLSNEDWAGHPFSGGVTSKIYADRIHQTLPDAKILIVTRDPVDLALSIFAHFVVKSGYSGTLESFLDSPMERQIPWHNSKFYDFKALKNYYISLFGEDNVLVLKFEDLLKDSDLFIDRICKFSGVKAMAFDKEEKNKRDYNEYAALRCCRHLNLFSVRNPANGNYGLNWRIRGIGIKFIKLFLSNKAVKRILSRDREKIKAFLKKENVI